MMNINFKKIFFLLVFIAFQAIKNSDSQNSRLRDFVSSVFGYSLASYVTIKSAKFAFYAEVLKKELRAIVRESLPNPKKSLFGWFKQKALAGSIRGVPCVVSAFGIHSALNQAKKMHNAIY